MKDERKTKKQLINELVELRQRVAELETSESERKRAERETLQRAARLAAINRVSAAVSSTLDLSEILNTVTQQMAELFAVEHSGILMFDEKKEWGYVLAEYPDWGAAAERFEVKGYLAAERVIADQKPLMIEDVLTDPLMAKVRDTMRRLGIKSMLIVPLLVKGETIGSIGLDAKERRVFSQEEIELAQTIANQVAMAIENAQLYEETRRRSQEVATLNTIVQALNASLEVRDVFQVVATELKRLVEFDRASIVVLDQALQNFTVYTLVDQPDTPLGEGVTMPVAASAAGQNALAGRPHLTEDLSTELDFPAERLLYDAGLRSRVIVPLMVGERIIGSLNLASTQPAAFSERHLGLLQQMAGAIAAAVQNARLFEETERLKAFNEGIVQSMAEGIVVEDAEGYFTFVNPTTAALLGYVPEELLGQHWTAITPPDQQPIVQAADERRMRGEADRYELELVCKDGRRRSVLVSGSPRFEGGRFVGTLAVFTDITDRKRAEEELQESEQRFQDVASTAGDWIWEVDAEGRYTYASPVVEQVLGYTPEEVLGKHYYDFFHPDDREMLKAQAQEALRKKEPFVRFINRNVHRDGRTVVLETSGLPLIDAKGNLLGYRGADRDITARVWREEMLHALNAAAAAVQRAARTPEAVFAAVMEQLQALELIGGVVLLDETREQCTLRYTAVASQTLDRAEQLLGLRATGYTVPVEQVPVGQRILAGETVFVPDVSALLAPVVPAPVRPLMPRAMRLLEMTRGIVAPLSVKGEIIGFLGVSADRLTEADMPAVTAFANQMAAALENAQLYEAMERRWREADTLRQAGAAVTETLSLEETLKRILEQLDQVVPYDSASVMLVSDPSTALRRGSGQGSGQAVLRVMAARGFPDVERTMQVTIPVADDVLFQEMLRTRQPVVLADAQKDERFLAAGETTYVRGWIGAPLVVKGQVIGNLTVDSRVPGAYGQEEAEVVAAFAAQAAIAIENARLFEAEQRRRRDAEALRQTALALTSALDRNQVIERILSQLQQVVPYDSASVQLLRGDRLEIIGGRGFPNLEEIVGISFPVDGDNPNREVMRTLSPFILEDAPAMYEAFTQEPFAAMGIRSWLGVPMLVGGRPVGMITLDKCQPGFYTEEHARLAQAFAAQAAIAIENARLFEEEERRITQLRTISEVARDIASILDLDKLLHRVVELLVETFGYYYANVLMVDKEAQEIVLTATASQTGRAFEGLRLKIGKQGITGWVAASGEPLLVNDVDKEPRYYSVEELADTRSELAAPIKLREEVIGVLDVQSVELAAFDQVDLSTLTTLADQLAVAIENVRLFEEEQRRAAQLAVVNEVGRHATSTLELDQILHQVTTAIQTGFGYYNVATLLVEGEYAVLKAIAGGFAEEVKDGYRQHLSQGIIGWCITHAQTVLANDVSRDPRFIPGFLEKVATQSELCVPIKMDGKVVGALDVQSTELNAFDQWDARALETLADQVSLAVKNALTYGRLDEEKGRLELLYQVAAEVNRSLDLDEILAQAIQRITTNLGGQRGYVFLVEPGTDRLWLHAASGVEVSITELNEALDVHVGQGLVGWVTAHGEAAVVDDVTQDERWLYVDELDRGVRSVMTVPLVRGEETLGALSVLHPRPGFFDEAQCRLLMAIAQQVAVAVANARLHETVQEQAMLDSLTQVYNHGELIRRLHVAVEEGGREDQPVSYIMLDVDYFKEYNDRYGHVTGDLILTAIVQAIRANVKMTDIVGRWGGEEFGIVLPHTDSERAEIVAERIRHTLATMPLTDDKGQDMPKPTVSQGIATYPTTAASAEQLIDLADVALYRAKARGRDQVDVV